MLYWAPSVLLIQEQKEEEERERRERIVQNTVPDGQTKRDIEYAQIRSVLAPRGLGIASVRPDGHCLFAAVLRQAPAVAPTVQALRSLVAEHMSTHSDEYIYFLSNKSGDPLSAGSFSFCIIALFRACRPT